MFRNIKSDTDRQHLQDDLNKLTEWTSGKCCLILEGVCGSTGHEQYTVAGTVLNTTIQTHTYD